MSTYRTALSIAGSDCSGGAGIQADIKTMSALGVYAMTAITAVTVQNTCGVRAVAGIAPEIVKGQIEAIFTDIRPDAVKIGMLFTSDIASAVAGALRQFKATNIVLDPVMVATSGDKLLSDEAIETIKTQLIPLSDIITPNVAEALVLTGTTDSSKQCRILHELGAKAVLLKGGDDKNATSASTDILSLHKGSQLIRLTAPRIATANTHGTGCTLSSAIASRLALGDSMEEAVTNAKTYINRALEAGANVNIGHGHGPVNHLSAPHPLTIV